VELRDGVVLLRPWLEEDVPALVDACNDAEITRWIPVIPTPYTEEDARAFVRGEVEGSPEYSFAVTAGEALAGAIADAVLAAFSVDEAEIRVRKPKAPLPGAFETVEVRLRRRRDRGAG